jgi:phage terminase large subunit GpA-like protein
MPRQNANSSSEKPAPFERVALTTCESSKNAQALLQTAEAILRPPPQRNATEWAESCRVLPGGTNSEPGPFRASRTPYMIPICNAVRHYRRIIIVMGTQMGKTTSLTNMIGHKLDDDPAPILYIAPTKSSIDTVVEPQIAAMLRSTPSLWAKTERGKMARKLAKKVAGVSLRLAWGGSKTELASQPVHTVLTDEVDKMEPIPGEGDPLSLAEARIATFPDGRIIVTSSPTEGNVEVERDLETGLEHWTVAKPEDVISKVWSLWQGGTRFEWAVPCPDCKEYFVPRFKQLNWPAKCTPERALKETRMCCAVCGVMIEDRHRPKMNAAGLFVAPGQKVVNGQVVGEPPATRDGSFWVSGLMSPWVSWGARAADFIAAHNSGDEDLIRACINTALGELYSFRGQALSSDVVRKCVAPYASGTVPDEVRWLTCGVDVQKRQLYYAVRGWTFRGESWLIEAGEIAGETDEPHVWNDLEELLNRDFAKLPRADAPVDEPPEILHIRRMGIDSGYRPGDKHRRPDNLIYEFCRKIGRRVLPTKGHDQLTKPLSPSLIDVTFRGVLFKKGLQLWHMDSDYFKAWLNNRLTWPVDQPGRFWVPQDVTDDYCLQITAETRVAKPSGRAIWIKVRAQNHYLDCEAINVAMAYSMGLHRKIPRKRVAAETPDPAISPPAAQQIAAQAIGPAVQPTTRTVTPPGPGRSSGGGWIKKW